MLSHKRVKTYYSIIGAYSFDPTIFDNFKLPESVEVSPADLIEYIIIENSDLPLAQPNLDLFRIQLKHWCKKNEVNWARIWQTLTDDYNPLHNYNRFEDVSETTESEGERSASGTTSGRENETADKTILDVLQHTGESEEVLDGNEVITYNTTDRTAYGKTLTGSKNTTETHTGTEQNDHANKPFNADISVTARDTITKNLTDTESTTTSETAGGVDTLTKTGTESTATDNTINKEDNYTDTRNITDNTERELTSTGQYSDTSNDASNTEFGHTGHLYGNIGVTTSQSMLTDEIDVRMKYNFYDILSEEFKREFCIMVY